MKKTTLLLLFLLSSVLLFGCARKTVQAPTEEPTDNEIRGMYQAALDKWAGTQTLLEIDHISIDRFVNDRLLMDELRNEKKYSNIFLDVGVYFDPKKVGDGESYANEYEVTKQVYDQVRMALRKSEYDWLRIKELTVYCKDLEGSTRNTDPLHPANDTLNVNLTSSLTMPQPEDELHVQTIAYEYVKAFNKEFFSDTSIYFPYGEVTLRRFGIRPDAGDLYIEIPIYSVGGTDDAEQTAFKNGLEGRSEELLNTIMADEKAVQYLCGHAVRTVTVAYYTPWETQGKFFYTYCYDLEL